ncbi:MAG: asparagine synthase-related protein [Candidatus Thermoplasmatota archaeon]|nr:asparagine synthase-related protein [Candidatus Thermoplasmatota archaeon]
MNQKSLCGSVHESKLDSIIESLRNDLSTLPSDDSALAYSGGLDSTILMALSDFRFSAYTVGFSDSKDIASSRRMSDLMGFKVNEIVLDHMNTSDLFMEIRKVDPEIETRDIGYEAVLLSVLKSADQKYIVTGQGADEFFYGYQKYERDPGLSNMPDIEKLKNITAPRENRLSDSYGKKIVVPYMNQDVIDIALNIPRDSHINKDGRKIILRSIAKRLGLPDEVVNLRKTAAQYGSGLQKVVRKTSGS